MITMNKTKLGKKDLSITRTGVRRLRKLAAYLLTISPAEFDMDQWFTTCGTPACALGYATQIKAFRRAGLVADRDEWNYSWTPRFNEDCGEEAAASFFQCSPRVADALFIPMTPYWENATPRTVANGINRVCDAAEKCASV